MKARNICAEITEKKESITLIDKELYDMQNYLDMVNKLDLDALVHNHNYDDMRYFISHILHDRMLRDVLISYMAEFINDRCKRLKGTKKLLEEELKELGEKEWVKA